MITRGGRPKRTRSDVKSKSYAPEVEVEVAVLVDATMDVIGTEIVTEIAMVAEEVTRPEVTEIAEVEMIVVLLDAMMIKEGINEASKAIIDENAKCHSFDCINSLIKLTTK